MAVVAQQPAASEPTAVPRTKARASALAIAGVLLVLAGSTILMGIITAEALYPDVYTTHDNEISDLGATRPPNSIIRQPSATVFNAIMIVSGVGILGGAYGLHRSFRSRRVTISVASLGVGVLGVGVFPGNVEGLHPLFALTAFTSAGIAAILSAHVQTKPFGYLSILLGVVTLVALVVGVAGEGTPVFDKLGDGGVERWIAYPAVLWLVSFGGYLAALAGVPEPTDTSACRPIRHIAADVRRQ